MRGRRDTCTEHEMTRRQEHRRVRDLPHPKKHHPKCELFIRENALQPYVVCDSRACYWHPKMVRVFDGNIKHVAEGTNEQLIRMMLDGAFGEQVKDAFIDPDRWWYIHDNLIDIPIEQVIAGEGLYLLDVRAGADGDAGGSLRRDAGGPGIGGPTTGPRPTSWSGTVTRNAKLPSFTYVFQFGARELWKIGHATDISGRLAEVNKHVPHEVLREKWQVILQHPWRTEADAYSMEQRVLKALRTPTCVGERVACTREALDEVWASASSSRT
jgi:hypothetical protein